MIGPEWNHEKSVVFLRWIFVLAVFASLLFFTMEHPNAIPHSRELLVLGGIALVLTFMLNTLFGKVDLNQYHYLGWAFDFIVIFLLIKYTGGAFFEPAKTTPPFVNIFLFLFPLLVLNNSIGKNWQSGLGSALLVNIALLYFLLTTQGALKTYWSLFAFLGIFNFALGSLFMFSEQWIVVGDTTELKEREREVEQAYQTLRKEIEIRKRREQELSDKISKLHTITQVSRALGSIYDLPHLFEMIVEKAKEEVNSQMAFIMLEKDSFLEVVHAEGVSEITQDVFKCRVAKGQSVIADVMLKSEPIRISRKENPDIFSDFAGATERLKTMLLVPLKAPKDKKPIGVLGVANLYVGDSYTQEHEDFLAVFAIEAAMFIRQLQLKHDLERSYFELIMALAQAIEAKDPYTRGHVQRVAEYSIRLARALRLPPSEISRIEKAAILHDIGKIATPEHILNKPGRLTDEEFAIMKMHVVESRKMLSEITAGIDEKTKDYVAYHHERWDGKGYPEGLKGDEIPLGAQIIAVADTFDAMTSDRPYRKGFPPEEALRRLINTAGTQFNPHILHTFFDLMNFDKETGKIKSIVTDTIEIKSAKVHTRNN